VRVCRGIPVASHVVILEGVEVRVRRLKLIDKVLCEGQGDALRGNEPEILTGIKVSPFPENPHHQKAEHFDNARFSSSPQSFVDFPKFVGSFRHDAPADEGRYFALPDISADPFAKILKHFLSSSPFARLLASSFLVI